MLATDVACIFAFFVLLGFSIWMLIYFYCADSYSSKDFVDAENNAPPPGSRQYVLYVLQQFGTNGSWPIPYIAASIVTPLALMFLTVPITVRNFAILFLTSFVIFYFMNTFIFHHYLRPVANYTSNYIINNCPASVSNANNVTYIEENNNNGANGANGGANGVNVENNLDQVNNLYTKLDKKSKNKKKKKDKNIEDLLERESGFNVTFVSPVSSFE